jgi:hypothetical protein
MGVMETTMLEWLGKFHLLLLHFPLALALAAAAREAWSVWCGWRRLISSRLNAEEDVHFCLLAAALFAVPTTIAGWLHALDGSGGSYPGTLLLHRWLGTAACVLIVMAAWSAELDMQAGRRHLVTRVLIFLSALVVSLTGHFGGLMAHGPDFFSR